MLMTKPRKIAALKEAGWTVIRKRGEPVWFRDPLGCEVKSMRVDEAYELQRRREDHGVVSHRKGKAE